jgi:hypothetical protein
MEARKRLTRKPRNLTRLNKDNRFSRLPLEILRDICILLDLKQVYDMRSLSKLTEIQINRILYNFWMCSLQDKDMQDKLSNTTYKIDPQLLLNISKKICEDSLKNLPHQYFWVEKNIGTSVLSFFTHKTFYVSLRVSFCMEELIPLLLTDNANRSFRKVSRIGDIIPHIQDDHFDKEEVQKVLTFYDNNETNKIFSRGIIVGDAAFVAFLPTIIKFRALKCFDLFLRAYLALTISFPSVKNVKDYEFGDVLKLIIDSNNDYFIKHFLELTINLLPFNTNSNDIFQVIENLCLQGYGKIVTEVLSHFSRKDFKNFLDKLNGDNNYSKLLTDFSDIFDGVEKMRLYRIKRNNAEIKEQCKNKCTSVCSQAISSIEANKVTPKRLEKIRDKIFNEINDAIELLKTRQHIEETDDDIGNKPQISLRKQ